MHQSPARPRGTRPLAVVSESGVFVGYASLFNRADAAGDIILPGAFSDSLKHKGAAGIRMLFQHDPGEPVGAWIDIVENARGLLVRGRLNTDVQRGRELSALLDQRALDGLSIGFKTVAARRDRATGFRHIARVDLWEVSLVTFPMLAGARVSEAKRRAAAELARLFRTPANQGVT
jgi:HK97 family phage prohead protease